jgi:hypothetical protein
MSEKTDVQNIQRAIDHLRAALALFERTRPTKVRREEWFEPSGHLSKKGVARLKLAACLRLVGLCRGKKHGHLVSHCSSPPETSQPSNTRKKNPPVRGFVRARSRDSEIG